MTTGDHTLADRFAAISLDGLSRGGCRHLEAAGRPVLVTRDDDGHFHAFEGVCPHALLPLDGARVRRGAVLCPHHGARFDCRTGEPLGPPAATGLRALKLARRGDGWEVELP
jgi:3-phenylpropionate/trans-cinnamate dioxygenase ferredoxin subunit